MADGKDKRAENAVDPDSAGVPEEGAGSGPVQDPSCPEEPTERQEGPVSADCPAEADRTPRPGGPIEEAPGIPQPQADTAEGGTVGDGDGRPPAAPKPVAGGGATQYGDKLLKHGLRLAKIWAMCSFGLQDADADDVASVALTNVWLRLPNIPTDSFNTLLAYLYHAVRNEALAKRRKIKKGPHPVSGKGKAGEDGTPYDQQIPEKSREDHRIHPILSSDGRTPEQEIPLKTVVKDYRATIREAVRALKREAYLRAKEEMTKDGKLTERQKRQLAKRKAEIAEEYDEAAREFVSWKIQRLGELARGRPRKRFRELFAEVQRRWNEKEKRTYPDTRVLWKGGHSDLRVGAGPDEDPGAEDGGT